MNGSWLFITVAFVLAALYWVEPEEGSVAWSLINATQCAETAK